VCERRRVPSVPLKRSLLASLLAAAVVAASCTDDAPAPVGPEPLPNAGALIPPAPAAQPTPTPTPGAVPDESPFPATPGSPAEAGGGVSAGCGAPAPPSVTRMNVTVHGRQANRVLLDSTPLVGPDAAYCRQIGFTDGRLFCPVRPEGHAERLACEAARVGRAADTGRVGPSWSANGKRCNGEDGGASCLNHPDNQFLAFAYGAGRFRACAASGVCGEISLP
jgi:hypothetical protein